MASTTTTSNPPPRIQIHDGASIPYQTGWNLAIVLFTLFLVLFLSTLESTIVATALVQISSDLGNFEKSSWVPIAYLICYTGFLVIFSRFSDIFGRRPALVFSVTFFTIFSGACGAAQTMTQLLVFRSFQGIGGGAMYSSVMGTLTEIAPPGKLVLLIGIMGATFALSSILGPLLGGIIVQGTTWRWIFLLNVPGGVLIISLLLWKFPGNVTQRKSYSHLLSQIDYLGAALSLAGTTCFIYALEAGSLSFSWKTPAIITTLTCGIGFWCLLCFWETWLSRRFARASRLELESGETPRAVMLPMFPTRIVKSRSIAFAFLSVFFSGFTFFVAIVSIPQRYQIEDGLSPSAAGVRLIPLLICSALGATLSGGILKKFPRAGYYVLLVASSLQIICLGLLSTLKGGTGANGGKEYGYEILLGLGLGFYNSTIMVIGKAEINPEDMAVSIGIITQLRTLGGIIGLAIGQIMLFHNLVSSLAGKLPTDQLTSFLSNPATLATFSPSAIQDVRSAYSTGFSQQLRTIMYFSAVSFGCLILMYRKGGYVFEEIGQSSEQQQQHQSSAHVTDVIDEEAIEMKPSEQPKTNTTATTTTTVISPKAEEGEEHGKDKDESNPTISRNDIEDHHRPGTSSTSGTIEEVPR